MKKLIILALLTSAFSACEKEQKTANKLEGKWKITELAWANGKVVDVTSNSHTIEFLSCDKAYTTTCRGIYFIDYADTLRKDINDTFSFELKKDEIAISGVKNSVPANTFVTKFLRQRYQIEQLKDDSFEWKRFRTFADSTDGLVKANKL